MTWRAPKRLKLTFSTFEQANVCSGVVVAEEQVGPSEMVWAVNRLFPFPESARMQ
jgi:hypothetical protein